MFNCQEKLAHQLLVKLQDQPLPSQLVFNPLLDEFSNINNIYESYKPTIRSAVQLLRIDSENTQSKRCLFPFLGDALKWLTDTATMRETWEIKQHINQLIQTQTKQHETLDHVIFILNITRYAAQVNRQKLNEIIDALQRSNEDLDRLFNIIEVLTQHMRYQQMFIYMHTMLAYFRDLLTYMKQVSKHMMDFVDAATTNVLSPDILPVKDLRNMLRHIESELPLMMHLSISLDDILHFYWYLSTHVLITDGQFLLLIDVAIQNRAQQLQIYEIFSLPVPHNNLSVQYKINHKYMGETYDETKEVAVTDLHYRGCQHTNRQFCRINAPFKLLTSLTSCVTILYSKNDQAIKEQCSFITSHMPHTYIHTHCCYFKYLDHSLKPSTLGSTMTIICPDKAIST